MARQESEREDLLGEATALVERAELRLAGFSEPVVVGFRRGGAASFFFGSDPVYQFNAAGQLRRAFIAGRLLKAERCRLIAMTRERTPLETALVRSELDSDEEAELLAAARRQLAALGQTLNAGEFEVVGVVPPGVDVVGQIRRWLAAHRGEIAVAPRPNVQ